MKRKPEEWCMAEEASEPHYTKQTLFYIFTFTRLLPTVLYLEV